MRDFVERFRHDDATQPGLAVQEQDVEQQFPASRSLLVLRAARADAEGMPPIRPRLVDEAGVALLTAWVESLQNCT